MLKEERNVHREFLEALAVKLRPLYVVPNVAGGHAFDHVERMVEFGPKIKEATKLDFDLDEYEAAVWLHNIDRVHVVVGIKSLVSLSEVLRTLLRPSAFNGDARGRIIYSVLYHNKKDDEPGDLPLLTALRIADKLDRLGPVGILSVAAHLGSYLSVYDKESPFGYQSTTESELKTFYDGYMRSLEWVGMLPSDQARSLIDRSDLFAYVSFLRAFATEISRRHGVSNLVENDIRKALGSYYREYAFYPIAEPKHFGVGEYDERN